MTVDVSCTNGEEGECVLPSGVKGTSCQERPLKAQFLFTGKGCDEHVVGTPARSCTGGSAVFVGQRAFIEARSSTGEAVYFRGLVKVGEIFEFVATIDAPFPDDPLVVTIRKNSGADDVF